jgi:hypothetical protein
MQNELQRLVDITFSVAALISDPQYRELFDAMTQDERMTWVAKQLRECGFDTEPRGASWGVLTGRSVNRADTKGNPDVALPAR